MTDGTTGTAAGRRAADHLLGRFRGSAAGPLLVCIGGIHGNEPAGVAALERVVASLTRERPPFRGELVALRGNLAALELGRRFVDEDLNRIWTLPRIGSLRENGYLVIGMTETLPHECRDTFDAVDKRHRIYRNG